MYSRDFINSKVDESPPISVMEEIKCTKHQETCYLKTGTKSGPNYGVSFYVCPLSCGFFQQTQNSPRQCPQHEGQIIDLQAVFVAKTSEEKRQYHRCHGRNEGQSWCGYTQKKSSVKPLADYNHQHSRKQTTTDSSIPAEKLPEKHADKNNRSTGKTAQVTDRSLSDTSGKEEDIIDGVSNLSIIEDSDDEERGNKNEGKLSDQAKISSENDEGITEAMSNLSTCEVSDSSENHEDKNSSVSSSSSGSLPSPGLSGKDTKPSPRTDIAEKYGKYKIKKKSASNLNQSKNEQSLNSGSETSNTEDSPQKEKLISKSDADLPLSERIRLKYNENKQPSASARLSASSSTKSPTRQDEVIDLVSSSEEEKSDDEDGLARQPNRYQPPLQNKQQTASHVPEKSKSGSESIIKDAVKKVQDQQGQMKSLLTSEITAQGQGQKPALQPIQPKPSGLTSAAQYNLQLDMDRRTELQRQYERLKSVIATAKMSALPDKGEKLRKQADDLERALKAVNKKIANVTQYSSNTATAPTEGTSTTTQPVQYQTYKVVQPGGQTTVIKMPVSATTQPISQHQPHNPQGLKQTSILAHTQTIPPHIMQQLYAANPQALQLYGGRMTNQRMRDVTSITTGAIEKLHKQLETCPEETEELDDPEGLKVPLMVHQKQALAWMSWREKQQPAGGILADDMGLGKTLTMISMILKQKQLKEGASDEEQKEWLSRDKQLNKLGKNIIKTRATLVICPASLIHQWKTEIERRVKGSRLKVLLYHGPNRESDVLKLADNDVVITTYNLIGKEVGAADINAENPAKDEDEEEEKNNEMSAVKHKSDSKLLRIAWERIILDEAHNIKNNKSLTAMSVCRLRAGFRWALTGTPIQNQLLDIFSLLRFLRCSPFDEYKLWKRQVDTGKDSGQSRLNVLVKCLLLRRTKNQIDKAGKPLVDLPSKTIKEYEIKLSDDERKVYEKIYAQSKSAMRDYLKRHEEKEMGITHKSSPTNVNPFQDKSPSNVGGQGSQYTGNGMQMNSSQKPGGQMILVMLLRLRQCCCHLSLMKDALEDDIALDEGLELDIVEQMRGMGLDEEASKEPTLSKSSSVFEKFSLSTKVEAVMKKLQEIRDSSDKSRRQKSVIVSQWTKMLDIIAIHLDKQGVKYNVIQGNIPPKKRNEFVEDFNTNPRGSEVMLVSLRAGGVGLNLIGGNHLFLLDQHWNPALEDQACDRIYRVGQTREVMIHRFLCKDTVEEKIVELQQRKKTLATNVLTGSKTTSSKLTLQDLRMIFGV